MYGREYGGRELRFEASGGLIHYSLVMQDKETDSYWSIMTGGSLAGDYKGTRLEEWPEVAEKAQWRDWVRNHPETVVLSVDGSEHIEQNPYENYFTSDAGPRGSEAVDDRLPTKTSVFSFLLGEHPYAVPYAEFEGGAAFDLGEQQVFLYRPSDVAIFHSTVAFVTQGAGFEVRDGAWTHVESGARFDAEVERFVGGGGAVPRLGGFDTFWFNWSMTHPDTEVLTGE